MDKVDLAQSAGHGKPITSDPDLRNHFQALRSKINQSDILRTSRSNKMPKSSNKIASKSVGRKDTSAMIWPALDRGVIDALDNFDAE
jgi:hypothetical protein